MPNRQVPNNQVLFESDDGYPVNEGNPTLDNIDPDVHFYNSLTTQNSCSYYDVNELNSKSGKELFSLLPAYAEPISLSNSGRT